MKLMGVTIVHMKEGALENNIAQFYRESTSRFYYNSSIEVITPQRNALANIRDSLRFNQRETQH